MSRWRCARGYHRHPGFRVPTQLVQVSEANRVNVAAGVGQPGKGYRQWFHVQVRADGDGGLGDCKDVRCSFSCFTLSVHGSSGTTIGNGLSAYSRCIVSLLRGQGDLVCAVRPQFGHLDGRGCVWDVCLGDG